MNAIWRDQSIRFVIMMVFVHAKMESMVIDAPDANVICLASQIVKVIFILNRCVSYTVNVNQRNDTRI